MMNHQIMMVLLDANSILHVVGFLPMVSIKTCRCVDVRWFVIANMVIRQWKTMFEEIRQMMTPSSEDYRQFCDIYLDRGYDKSFLEEVSSGIFQRPRMARMYIMGVIGDPNKIIKVTARSLSVARLVYRSGWDTSLVLKGKKDLETTEVMKGVIRGGHTEIMDHHRDWLRTDQSLTATAMVMAGTHGHIDMIKMCIDSWTRREDGRCEPRPEYLSHLPTIRNLAMCCAATHGQIDAVRMCIEHGGDSRGAMRTAVCNNAPRLSECIRLCHKHGCDVNTTCIDDHGHNEPLISIAVRNKNIDAVRTLLSLGSRQYAIHNENTEAAPSR